MEQNSNNIRPRRVEPGPENIHFQYHAFDENLGIRPITHKPLPPELATDGAKSITALVIQGLKDVYKALNE